MAANEGCVFTDMENFIELVKKDVEMVAEWNLWKLLFSDKNEEVCIYWKNQLRKSIGFDILKNNLLEYQIKRSVAKFGTNFDYVFIDDRVDISLYKYYYFELATTESNNAFQLFLKIN